jgi:hypothetical protein
MEIREDVDTPTVLEFSTHNNKIQITDEVNGVFTILPSVINIPFGTYKYDIQITFPTGRVKTYITGSWKIIPDITQ